MVGGLHFRLAVPVAGTEGARGGGGGGGAGGGRHLVLWEFSLVGV